jgi:hypothetical protein
VDGGGAGGGELIDSRARHITPVSGRLWRIEQTTVYRDMDVVDMINNRINNDPCLVVAHVRNISPE